MTVGEVPPPEKVRRGGWILAALAVLALAVFFTDEVQQELAEGPTLWIAADQTRTLKIGAPVWLAGHRVGRVTGLRLRPPTAPPERRVLVRAVIREGYADRFRADASADLAPAGLLERTVVSVRPGSPSAPPFDFSDTLQAGTTVTSAELRARAEDAMAALDSLRRAEERVRALADTGGGTVARLRDDAALQRRLLRLRQELGRAAALARSDSSGLARLARNPDVARGIRATLGAADSLAVGLEATATRWRTLGTTLASLRERADTLEALLAESRGSAGRFLHDRALERELGELRSRIAATRAELLSNPLRWLRFQLFRSF